MAKVLVVADNPNNRELLVTFLGYCGHSLREATDGAEALALVSSEHPDLVIADILMPTMDGYELVRRLRSLPEVAQTPVIFCTPPFMEREAKDLARKSAVKHVLVNPVDLDAVKKLVDTLVDKTSSVHVGPVEPLLSKLMERNNDLAIVNLRLEELLKTTLRYLASESDPRRLIQEFCKSARELINARCAVVGLVSADGEIAASLEVAGLEGATNSSFQELQKTHRAVRVVIGNNGDPRPVRLRNPGGKPEALGFPPDCPSFDSILAAPIASPKRTYGWLCLFQKLGAQEFSEEEQHLAGTLGSLVGRIYENTSHANELERELAERRRKEVETRNAEQQLSLALKASRTGIWTWDALKDLMVWDENVYDMFGVPWGAFGGTFEAAAAMVHPEDRDATISEIHRCTPQRPACVMAFRVVWSDGSIHYLEANGRGFHDKSGQLIRMIGTTRDITEQRQLQEQLRQAQKMEAVGQLAGGIAHDFNNMLNTILGYAEVILAQSSIEDSIYARIEEIRKAGEQASVLTQQLLAFGRRQLLQPRVLNVADTLRGIDALLRRVIGADVEIITVLDEPLAQVKVDPTQIQQVLLNLAVNARDAMPQGGKLVLEAKNATLDESQARRHEVPAGRYVMLSVSDDGCGMTADIQKRVFEPFFTTKEVGQGTGLGLATAYGIVQQSGGHISLYSEPGVGTTFQMLFPSVEQLEEAAQPTPAQTASSREDTILVVEDDAGIRALVEEVLTSAGYRVLVAEDGVNALRISTEYAGPIQLLLTDVILPKMSGKEVAANLRALRPEMIVLFMSGYTREVMAHNGTLDPEVNFIQKPWSPRVLRQKIQTLLSTNPPVPANPGAGFCP
jgi:PAS domain S-box-containing protein